MNKEEKKYHANSKEQGKGEKSKSNKVMMMMTKREDKALREKVNATKKEMSSADAVE